HFTQQVAEMHNEQGESIGRAPHPMMILTMPVKQAVQVGDMIRKQK
ncbi:U32 family peptidase C-terminal domain-containing protein, partial [Tetragenococcus halophilus]